MFEWFVAIVLVTIIILVLRHIGVFEGIRGFGQSTSNDGAGEAFENWVGPKSLDPRNPASLINNDPDSSGDNR